VSTPAFIVGTGRCGSTMLSDIVRRHPGILSISELFAFAADLGGRIAETFPDGDVDAEQVRAIVAAAHPRQTLMHRHDAVMDEVLYRRGRFLPEVPAILQTALPHLALDSEALFEEVVAFLATAPRAAIGVHYQRLFDWLAARFGKRSWIERSGGSLRVVKRLAEAFPGARFVHIVRDGRTAAMSMRKHYGFRLALIGMQLTEILGCDPFESADRTWLADVPDDLACFLPEQFDADAFRRHDTPLPLCGHYWSGEIIAGTHELAQLPAERVLTLRYEDFLAEPRANITRLIEFLDDQPVDAAWLAEVAAMIRPARSAIADLPAHELAQLEEACRPGFEALGALYA
jgi:hypothetical protein